MPAKLNSEQLAAVTQIDKHLLVVAGPGTGKTKVLTQKVLYLLERGIIAEQILALTFTKKSASEMQERVKATISDKDLPFISTFHGFAHQLLSNSQEISLIDQTQQLEIISQIKQQFQLKGIKGREILRLVSLKKQVNGDIFPDWLETVFSIYQQTLIDKSKVDFDDLLIKARDLLKEFPQNYHYVLVDEFQDTNQLQYQLLKLLTSSKAKITVVGDPLQSIYSFRGSSGEVFDQFEVDFLPQKITLEHNYRNPSQVIKLSHSLFPEFPQLIPHQNIDSKVTLVETLNEYTEADFLLSLIEAKVGGTDLISAANRDNQDALDRQARFSDFVVMFRTHHFARALEKKFINSGIPFQKIGSQSPLAQPEIQLIIQELKNKLSTDEQKVSQFIDEIIKQLQLAKVLQDKPTKLNSLKEFQSLLVQFDREKNGLEKALQYIEYLENHDYYDERADKVTLLTMHAAKGLEFKYVYLCGFEDGIIPLLKKDKKVDLAEEKRLFYVALTRSKEEVFLFYTRERNRKKAEVSRFLLTLNQNYMTKVTDPKIKKILKKRQKFKEKRNQASLF